MNFDIKIVSVINNEVERLLELWNAAQNSSSATENVFKPYATQIKTDNNEKSVAAIANYNSDYNLRFMQMWRLFSSGNI